MITFLGSIVLLILAYVVYGAFIERLFGPDDRPTPAVAHPDGVDYVPLPLWKSFLIQLLNIAGLGPIFGALSGALWGPVVYLWIVLGTIFAGAVHDYLSGMMSLRADGASLPEIIGTNLGNTLKNIMRAFSLILLVLVGATFTTGPAGLLSLLTPNSAVLNPRFWLVVILAYYFLATLLPIDQLIARLYPFFGAALLFMCIGVGGGIVLQGYELPELWSNFGNLYPAAEGATKLPIWPLMCVTVACGAISGFHATQSPMIARCLNNEREGRKVFYGAMIAEGIIAMIWAAVGVSIYNGTGGLMAALTRLGGQASLVYEICVTLLGPIGGAIALIGVVACPITTGDTALRSARLTLADWFHIDQGPMGKRLILAVPLLAASYFFTQVDFQILWRYFAWCNQTLSVFTFWAISVYLARRGLNHWVSTIPALFMSTVCSTYILAASEGFGPMIARMLSGGVIPEGVHVITLSAKVAYPAGVLFAAACYYAFHRNVLRNVNPLSNGN